MDVSIWSPNLVAITGIHGVSSSQWLPIIQSVLGSSYRLVYLSTETSLKDFPKPVVIEASSCIHLHSFGKKCVFNHSIVGHVIPFLFSSLVFKIDKLNLQISFVKMLWLLPSFIKTLLYFLGCPVGGFMSFLSSLFYGVFLLCVIPAYFLYAGPEAALRLSLLLCIHSMVLMMIPNVLKMIIPMLEILLFVALLLLPVNITPAIAVWFYEKLIFVSSPLLSVFEAVNIVLLLMQTSQNIVDKIEEQPTLAKSVILGLAFTTFSLGLWLAYYIYNVYNSHSINRIIEAAVIICGILLIISLIRDEGIISDVPCLFFIMMCIVWALAKESSMAKTRIVIPSAWLKKVPRELSFVGMLFSITNSGLAPLGQLKAALYLLISPCLLLMAGLRVLSLGYLLQHAAKKITEQSHESSEEETDNEDHLDNHDTDSTMNIYQYRVLVIFVLTELLLRTISTTSYTTTIGDPTGSIFHSAVQWWNHADVVKTFFDFRIWRITQLTLVPLVYTYKLVIHTDDDIW